MDKRKRKINYLLIGGIFFVFLIASVFCFYYLQTNVLKRKDLVDQNKNIQQDVTTDSISNWKTYTDTELNFSLKYPEDWNQGSIEPVINKTIVLTPESVDKIEYQIQAVHIITQPNSNYLSSMEYYDKDLKIKQKGSQCESPIINRKIPESLKDIDITIIEGTCGVLNQGPRAIISRNGDIIDVSSSFVDEVDNELIYKILSTFKFLD